MASSAHRRAGQTGIIVAALLLVVAALMLVGAKPAGASANSTVSGSGSTMQFTCPTGLQFPASIQFNATKSKGTLSGFAFISGTSIVIQDFISGGTFNSNSYSLTGDTQAGSFHTCGTFTTTLPSLATLTGQCGTGVVIHYSDTAGEVGDFTGNVTCP